MLQMESQNDTEVSLVPLTIIYYQPLHLAEYPFWNTSWQTSFK